MENWTVLSLILISHSALVFDSEWIIILSMAKSREVGWAWNMSWLSFEWLLELVVSKEEKKGTIIGFLTFLPKMSILVRWGAVMGWGPWVVDQKVTSQPVPENHHGTVSSPRNLPGKTCRRRGFPRGVHCKGIISYLAHPLRAPHLSLVSCLFPRSSILWVVFPIQRVVNHLLCLCTSANCIVL